MMKTKRALLSVVVVVLFLTLVAAASASTTWYVDGVNGNDSNDCKSSTTACKTIGHAISLASSGDSIMVAAATYTENLTIGISLKVIGAGASTTMIDGGHISTVVFINTNAHVTLSKLTIQNGSVNNSIARGGGVYNTGVLTISDCTVTANSVSVNGPRYGNGPKVTLIWGGGIYNQGTLTINRTTLSSNTASSTAGSAFGGGIYNTGTLSISNSTLSRNTVTGALEDSSFGGGIYNSGTLTINNSTLNGNDAFSGHGAGIDNVGSLTINSSTVASNSANGFGGQGGGISNGKSAILQNSIVANNSGGNCSGTMISNGYNLSGDTTCSFNGTGDLNNTNPNLGVLEDNGGPTKTQALISGSPAIDAGNPNGCTDSNGNLLKTDQRGAPRPDREDSRGCDMGAYEKQTD